MPNHCSNNLSITVNPEFPEFYSKLVEAIQDGKLFNFICPVHPDLTNVIAGSYGNSEEQDELERQYTENKKNHGYTNWYHFCVSEWGTKWDIYDFDIIYDDDDSLTIQLEFNSAWSPATGIYDIMSDMVEIETFRATYFEPGCAFCGINIDGVDESYDIEEFTVDWIADHIPNSICEEMGLYEYAAECEAYDDEEDEEEDDEEVV